MTDWYDECSDPARLVDIRTYFVENEQHEGLVTNGVWLALASYENAEPDESFAGWFTGFVAKHLSHLGFVVHHFARFEGAQAPGLAPSPAAFVSRSALRRGMKGSTHFVC